MKKILFSTLIVVSLLIPAALFAEEPGFRSKLEYPSGYIAAYPTIEQKAVIRIFYDKPYYTEPFRLLRHESRLERSSFDNKSLS